MDSLEEVLTLFFQNNLSPGFCYGSKGEPFTTAPVSGKLVYQDGTACSASFAFSDVYLMPNKQYIVKTETGCAQSQGDSIEETSVVETKCKNLIEVLLELRKYIGHDPNTTGDMLIDLLDNKIARKGKDEYIIELLKTKKQLWKKLITRAWKYKKEEKDTEEEDIVANDESDE